MRTELDDDMVEAALGDLATADLPEPTIVALQLADELTGGRPTLDEAFFRRLQAHFTDGQILELGAALAVASGWQRFIEAFAIRPDEEKELRQLD